MRKIFIIIFLSFSNFVLAQEKGLKSEELMNDEFHEWVNDTLPLIRDQYSVSDTRGGDSVEIDELEIIKVSNVKVEKGKLVYLDADSETDNDGVAYVLMELERVHNKLPECCKLHIETKTNYHPCPYYFSKYEYKTVDYNVLLHTDSFWVRYYFYRYIDDAYIYNKKTKKIKYLSSEELRNIYDKLK